MLRYFQFQIPFDNTVDYTPHYSENPEIGIVIGTYGSVPYIDLQLHYLKNVNGFTKILVHDDCSEQQEELKALCKSYNVDFYSPARQQFIFDGIGSVGDLHAFYQGLIWAKQNNVELLVKISRRLIPCYEWKTNLINLIKESDATAYSAYCTKDPFNMRTELLGLYVPAYTQQYPLTCMQFSILNDYAVFAEFWWHELVKRISGNNWSDKWFNYIKNSKHGYDHSGYCMWQDVLGTCRFNNANRRHNTLWRHYSSKEDYLNELNKIFPNKYTINDL